MGHLAVVAKVVEKVELLWYSQLELGQARAFAVTVEPKQSRVSEAVPEPGARYSSVAAVKCVDLKGAVASLAVGWVGLELIETKVAEAEPEPGFAQEPRSSSGSECVLQDAAPMTAETEPGPAPVPMDSKELEAGLEVVFVLVASKAGLVMEATH